MIAVDCVSKKFGERTLFKDLSFSIEDNRFVLITGDSGVGKTTLLNMIGGLEKPDTGEIIVDGLTMSKRKDRELIYREHLTFLFQNYVLLEKRSVFANLKIVSKEVRSGLAIQEALAELGLEDCEQKKIYQLSGGEQQRVALARALIKKHTILLADEPVASLDKKNTAIIVAQLNELHEKGETIIISTHMPEIYSKADTFIHIEGGEATVSKR